MRNQLGIIASSISKVSASGVMLITTTSTSATWSPHTVTNPGSTLTWIATGGHSETIVADDPTFDLSSATGDVNFNVSDVSQVTVLKMWVAMNLTLFDGTGLIGVTTLDIYNNQITSLDITKCVLLAAFQVYNNTTLGTLDVSQNTVLDFLRCDSCGLTALDVSTNTILDHLRCHNNSITLGGLTLTPSITNLNMFSNPIAGSLNLSALTGLVTLACYSCQLTGLTLGGSSITSTTCYANASLTTLDVSAHTSMTLLFTMTCGLTNGITTAGVSSSLNSVRVQANNFSAAATNQLLADLVASGVINGNLHYRNNETGQGVTDRAQLITDGWTITNYAT